MQCRLTFVVSKSQRAFEIDDFQNEQKEVRAASKEIYTNRVEEIINKKLATLVTNVTDSRNLREEEDLENTKMG